MINIDKYFNFIDNIKEIMLNDVDTLLSNLSADDELARQLLEFCGAMELKNNHIVLGYVKYLIFKIFFLEPIVKKIYLNIDNDILDVTVSHSNKYVNSSYIYNRILDICINKVFNHLDDIKLEDKIILNLSAYKNIFDDSCKVYSVDGNIKLDKPLSPKGGTIHKIFNKESTKSFYVYNIDLYKQFHHFSCNDVISEVTSYSIEECLNRYQDISLIVVSFENRNEMLFNKYSLSNIASKCSYLFNIKNEYAKEDFAIEKFRIFTILNYDPMIYMFKTFTSLGIFDNHKLKTHYIDGKLFFGYHV